MITQTINLNLIPGGVLPRINVSQYDKGSRTLNFNIYNGAVLFPIPSGSSITIQGTKPDHTAFQYSCEYEGSVVTADLEQQMSVLAGEVVCEIAINKNTNLIGTGNFILCVEPAAVADDTVISETELPLIEQAIEAAAEAETSATAAAESAEEAASWSAHPPYIGENGNWYVYDPETEKFVNTGDPSRGPQGIQGETGPKGDTGVTPDITMNASVDNTSGTPAVVVTETGTDEDPVFSLAFSGLKGPQGDTGEQGETGPQGPAGPTGNGISNITKTGTSGLVDTYTITYTDGTTSTFTVTNGRDGSGSGDMSESDYDPTGSVKNAGGIPDFVADQISGKQNMILASALPIGGTTQTTVEGALGALNDVKQNIVLSSTMIIGGQTVTEVEPALRALNNKDGGHTIVNEAGTTYPTRAKLKFNGAIVSDDETNDATVVETVNPVEYEEDRETIQNQLTEQTNILGAKNLIQNAATSRVVNGVTFTVNDDGSVSTSGTANADIMFVLSQGDDLPSEDTILSGCPSGGSDGGYKLNWAYHGSDYGGGVTIPYNANIGQIRIQVKSGTNMNDKTFYPMLRLASDPDDTYVPYAMTNRELTDEVTNAITLDSTNNLNNITRTGIYYFNSAPTNSPESKAHCMMIVSSRKENPVDLKQLVLSQQNAIYTRSHGSDGWTSWYKFTGTVVS